MSKTKTAPKKPAAEAEKIDRRTLPKDQRGAPSTGQSAEEFTLIFDDLSTAQVKILKAANAPGAGRRETRDVSELAKATKLTPLQTRNGIRNLIPSGWLERVNEAMADDGEVRKVRGHYRISEAGRKRLATALD